MIGIPSVAFKRKTSDAPTAGSEVGSGDALTSPTGDRGIKKGGRARLVQSCFIHGVVLGKAGPKQQPSARAVTNAWVPVVWWAIAVFAAAPLVSAWAFDAGVVDNPQARCSADAWS